MAELGKVVALGERFSPPAFCSTTISMRLRPRPPRVPGRGDTGYSSHMQMVKTLEHFSTSPSRGQGPATPQIRWRSGAFSAAHPSNAFRIVITASRLDFWVRYRGSPSSRTASPFAGSLHQRHEIPTPLNVRTSQETACRHHRWRSRFIARRFQCRGWPTRPKGARHQD